MSFISNQLKEELDAAIEEKNQLKSDLQENVEMVRLP